MKIDYQPVSIMKSDYKEKEIELELKKPQYIDFHPLYVSRSSYKSEFLDWGTKCKELVNNHGSLAKLELPFVDKTAYKQDYITY